MKREENKYDDTNINDWSDLDLLYFTLSFFRRPLE